MKIKDIKDWEYGAALIVACLIFVAVLVVSFFDDKLVVSGKITNVIIHEKFGDARKRPPATRVVFDNKPEIIIRGDWHSIKRLKGSKVKIIVIRNRYGLGNLGISNYYKKLVNFKIIP